MQQHIDEFIEQHNSQIKAWADLAVKDGVSEEHIQQGLGYLARYATIYEDSLCENGTCLDFLDFDVYKKYIDEATLKIQTRFEELCKEIS